MLGLLADSIIKGLVLAHGVSFFALMSALQRIYVNEMLLLLLLLFTSGVQGLPELKNTLF